MKRVWLLGVGLILATALVPCGAEEIGGVEFPAGAKSFADCLVNFEPLYHGGPGPVGPHTDDPLDTLGPPNFETNQYTGTVSLGCGGRVTIEFTDNFLTSSGDDRPDLYIFEVGPDVEDTYVEISADGLGWVSVGKVEGSLSSVDLDAFGIDVRERFRYVRLRDDPKEGSTEGFSVGADIDAIGAISATDRPEVVESTVDLVDDIQTGSRARPSSTPETPELTIRLPHLAGRGFGGSYGGT